jgi:hypothetical protein
MPQPTKPEWDQGPRVGPLAELNEAERAWIQRETGCGLKLQAAATRCAYAFLILHATATVVV